MTTVYSPKIGRKFVALKERAWQFTPKFQLLPWASHSWDRDFKFYSNFGGWLFWQYHYYSDEPAGKLTGPEAPVTKGYVEYNGLMTVVSFAAERNYVLSLYEQQDDHLEASHVLNAYLDGQMSVEELIKEFEDE